MADETRVTDWIAFGHNGVSHYCIWQRQTPHGMFQRHEWRRDDGSTRMDDWIKGGSGWTAGAKPVHEHAAA